jgi:DNA-binding XRE family transcriptional regulator
MRTMPPSVRRHNLARIREQLSLTQADLAKLVGCSLPTIKAVETGKLALSDGLASRISQALDFLDKDWLLKNDLDSPVPPILRPRSIQEDAHAVVLNELFSRLFAVVAKMDKHRARLMIELSIATELDALRREHVPKSDGKPKNIAQSAAIHYFIKNPDRFDPDLREWVNLEGLSKLSERYDFIVGKEEAQDQRGIVVRGVDVGMVTELFPPQAKNASPKHPKSPSQTPALPSPGGRHKKPKSS